MREHDFDPVYGWCTRCGAGRADVLDGAREAECVAAPNVISASAQFRSRALLRIGAAMRVISSEHLESWRWDIRDPR